MIASETQRGTSVVVLLEFQSKGKPVVAPIVIDGFGRQNSIRIDSNAITSLHGRDNAITRLLNDAIQAEQEGKVGIFYINKKKTAALLQRAGLQLPGGLFPDSGLIHSIREEGSPVNPMSFMDYYRDNHDHNYAKGIEIDIESDGCGLCQQKG